MIDTLASILAFALILFSYITQMIFITLVRRASLRVVVAFLAFAVLNGVFVAFFTILTFGGAFGPGAIMTCLVVPAALLALVTLVIGWRNTAKVIGADRTRKRLYIMGGLVIVVLQFMPTFGNNGIGGFCDAQTMRIGNTIIDAIQRYKQDHGAYPAELAILVPDYLPSIPSHKCLGDLGRESKFAIQHCSAEVTQLVTQSFNGMFDVRYNFKTGNWSMISFLDGACSFLR